MPREPDPTLNERAFVLAALREGVRLDGRALDAFRPLELKFGDEFGVAEVRLGRTRVLARISAEVSKPAPERKFEGLFTITTELSPMASPAFESGRASTELETLLSRMLEKGLRRSSALDTESLCLLAGLHVWSVRADIHVLDHDGGLLDAANLACLAALESFRLPATTVMGEEVRVWGLREKQPLRLAILHRPFCVTFAFAELGAEGTAQGAGEGDDEGGDGGVATLVDPTLLEAQVATGEMVVSANAAGEVCQVAKLGGVPVDAVLLLRCVEAAVDKVQVLAKFLKLKLEEDERRRDRGGLMAELRAENER